jgi:hypothetical protein
MLAEYGSYHIHRDYDNGYMTVNLTALIMEMKTHHHHDDYHDWWQVTSTTSKRSIKHRYLIMFDHPSLVSMIPLSYYCTTADNRKNDCDHWRLVRSIISLM